TLQPAAFVPSLRAFVGAKRPYQYGILAGFKKAWEAPKEKHAQTPWDRVWPALFDLWAALVASPEFWLEQDEQGGDLAPSARWIPPLIADTLKAGTADDAKAYPEALLPRGWALLLTLLGKVQGAAAADD